MSDIANEYIDVLEEVMKAAIELRAGIREAGVKRDPALYSRVMYFDSVVAKAEAWG